MDQAVANARRLRHHRRVLLKTDSEPAFVDLRRAVAERLGAQTVPEPPPAYELQSNDSVENVVRQLK
eukprot:9323434-Alexandrium_andersonii.AAC.1